MKNRFVGGVLMLTSALLVSKLLGAVFRIPLTNILGSQGIGVYQLVFPVYSLLFIFCSTGISLSLSKLIADARVKKDRLKIGIITKTALILSLMSSFLFAVLMFFFARQLSLFQGNSLAVLSYRVLPLALVFASMSGVLRGFFQGYENMLPSSISLVIEQLVKFVLGLLLAQLFLERGIEFAVMGAILGTVLGEIISTLYLYFTFLLKKKKYKVIINNSKFDFKSLLVFAIPITLGSIISPFSTALESFIVIPVLKTYQTQEIATSLYGLQTGMINPLINFPLILISAIAVNIIPSISYARKKGDTTLCNTYIYKTMKYTFIIIVACSVGYSLLSYNILNLLYPKIIDQNIKSVSNILFALSSITMLFTALASTITSVLQAQDRPYAPLINLAIVTCLKIVLAIVLMFNPQLNIIGLAIANAFSFLLYLILNYFSLRKIFDFKFNYMLVAKIFLSVIIMSIIILISKLFLTGYDTLFSLGIIIMLAVISYFSLLIILKVIDIKEIMFLVNKSKDKTVAEKQSK